MPKVEISPQLRRFFPDLADNLDVNGHSLANIVHALDRLQSGIAGYIVDERGSLRPHVNVFVNGSLIRDRSNLTDPVRAGDTVLIIQALSGD